MIHETSMFKRSASERLDPVWTPDPRTVKTEEVSTNVLFPGTKDSRTPKYLCILLCAQLRSGSMHSMKGKGE